MGGLILTAREFAAEVHGGRISSLLVFGAS